MDADLEGWSREQLIVEVKKLRQGIRAHRDSTGHELCWHHPALWALLPEKPTRSPLCPTGRSSFAAVFTTASRLMSNYLMHPEAIDRTASEPVRRLSSAYAGLEQGKP
jgi:hypothetical protein